MPLIRNLRLPALDAAGYVPLRCDWYPSCPAEIKPITHDAVVWGPGVHRQDAEDGIVEVWPRFFPGVELPETIAGHCCAQFAVTAGRIRSGERETYVKMREWLLETALLDDVSGRVLEKLWAFIFTEEAVQYVHTFLCCLLGCVVPITDFVPFYLVVVRRRRIVLANTLGIVIGPGCPIV